MRRVLAVLALLALAAVATGCAEFESGRAAPELGETDTPFKEPVKAKRVPRKWTDAHAVRYERAYRLCSVFSVEEVAEQYGARAKPRPAARAQARAVYRKPYREAAYHGCLDAFLGRAPGIR